MTESAIEGRLSVVEFGLDSVSNQNEYCQMDAERIHARIHGLAAKGI